MFTTQDGAQIIMTPHMARMNNLSYAANMYVDVHASTEHINQDGVKERTETKCRIFVLVKFRLWYEARLVLYRFFRVFRRIFKNKSVSLTTEGISL